MDFTQFIHIANPNAKNRSGVKKYFNKNPKVRAVWVDRESHPTHLETIVEWALIEGHKNIAVWGGDGTLSRVLQSLYIEDVLDEITVALIPTGTGNDFARAFQFGNWKKWNQKFKSGQMTPEYFDLGLVETDKTKRVFINNAGFGRNKEALDRKRPNPIKDILSFKEKRLQLEWGTQKINQFETVRCLFAVVFNSPFFNKGMHFSKDIHPNDGILTAFFIPPQPQSQMLGKFLKSKMGGSLGSPEDMRVEAEYLHVESEDPLYPQVDGEPVSKEQVFNVKFSILPGIARILVPRSS